ncbi:helix-turn-helix domain-containing protein [Ornithobacterium rhinotracheale]|uniref:helix-turn-helix domain-containing protein n=1 Tax=Ornithobacterium rhinotracheale TaxID=28251 RepID=UPI003FA47753
MKVNHTQLTLARESRGITQTELSKAVQGLSQSNLSKFEKGLGGLSMETLERIMKYLDFPISFLELDIQATLETANYRKKASISKKKIQKFETSCKIISHIIDQMSDSIEYPDFDLIQLNLDEGYTPIEAARFTRRNFRLKENEPVKDIFKLIENKGIVVYEIDIEDKFDGISLFTDKGFPVIVINRNLPNDRKRFTLAHELGHLVMHCSYEYPISLDRDKEKEANEFAAEFLMPTIAIRRSLSGLMYSDLYKLKNYWLTSKSSIVRRAYDLGVIDKNRYTYFNIELSRNGEKLKEKESVYIDYPCVFKDSVNIHIDELKYSIEELSQVFTLPIDYVEQYCLDIPDKKVKLKIIKR